MTNVEEYIKSLEDTTCTQEELFERRHKAMSRLQNWGYPRGKDFNRLSEAIFQVDLRLKNW